MVVNSTSSAKDLKSHLENIEREIMQMSVNPKPKESTSASKLYNDKEKSAPKITRDAFLAVQKKSASTEHAEGPSPPEFLLDLIKKPASRNVHRRSSSVVVPKPKKSDDYPGEIEPTTSSSSSFDSFNIPSRGEITQHDQTNLTEERRRLQSEDKRTIEHLKNEINDLRHKRLCERDALRDANSQLERELRELKNENALTKDKSRRNEHDVELLKSKISNLQEEIDRYVKDIAHLDARCAKSEDLRQQTEEKYRLERVRLEEKIETMESELNEKTEEMNRIRRREEANSAQIIELTTQNGRLHTELTALKDNELRYKSELDNNNRKSAQQIEDAFDRLRHAESALADAKQTLVSEEQRVDQCHEEITRLRNEKMELQRKYEEKERDGRELKALKETYEVCRTEKACSQAQVKSLRDEVNRLQGLLTERSSELTITLSKLQQTETDLMRAQKRIECSEANRIVGERRREHIRTNDLTDATGCPISRLRPADNINDSRHTIPAPRPAWWFEEVPANPAVRNIRRQQLGHVRSDDEVVPLRSQKTAHDTTFPTMIPRQTGFSYPARSAPTPLTSISPYTSCESVVVPVANRKASITMGDRLEKCKAEKCRIQGELAMMSSNPSYRTSDENLRYKTLRARLEELDFELDRLE